ncbi:MAG: hypothetical protein HC786_23225 [Richelia sp. CSU_2_1]|nr:hypothetical protein [Richelia sp. CSU_2_1]
MPTTLPAGLALSAIAEELKQRSPVSASASFVRPANTTAYAIGDIIFPAVPAAPAVQIKALRFPNALALGGSGFIVGAQLKLFSAQSTKLSADLHLFSAPPATAPVDSDPFAVGTNITQVEMEKHLTTISFPNSVAQELGAFTLYEVAPSKIVCAEAGSRDLYGILVAKNAYVPISGERAIVQLGVLPRAFL